LVLLKLWESRTEVFPIWAPDHKHPDSRGNRRYFTIASSPTEQHFRLGVKFYDRSSSFKKRMLSMVPGDLIMAGQLAGDFTMPRDPKKKLAFIAGGIGITPFRSMVKYLSDRDERRDVVLLYSNRAVSEIAYPDVFDEAAQTIGLKTIYAVTGTDETPPEKNGYKGHIDGALIRREIPDYRDRIFYISGTHAMVSVMETMLSEMGIPRRQIKIDFFPGFA
jgi:ferredoxin-NADP reductase